MSDLQGFVEQFTAFFRNLLTGLGDWIESVGTLPIMGLPLWSYFVGFIMLIVLFRIIVYFLSSDKGGD